MNLFAKATFADPSTLLPARFRALDHLGADTIVITGVVVVFATVASPLAEVTLVTVPFVAGLAQTGTPPETVRICPDVPMPLRAKYPLDALYGRSPVASLLKFINIPAPVTEKAYPVPEATILVAFPLNVVRFIFPELDVIFALPSSATVIFASLPPCTFT